MATRRERVILDLEDNYTAGVVRATAATGLLDKALNDLDGSSTRAGRSLDEPAKGTKRVGDESRKAGPDIDKYSGRLRTLADAALTVGPAIIPLGAAAIPALTGALAGLGAAAGGIGVTVLAMHGLGDAIKALDAYRLEPTAENLQKLRVEQEKLGPAAAEFSRYLVNLEPTLRDLQATAGKGLFPGLEDGIDALLSRGPEVTKIINRLSHGMGDLARDAGMSLAGGEFDAFFKYIETDAKPTLEDFGHAAGNVALGIANMLTAFAPLSRDFTGGLLNATAAFAEWSKGLDDNQSFQGFVDYIRESGPQVIDFLGALVQAFVGLLHAAAPYAQVVLPALTGLAKVFAAISESPIGPGLYAAAAGMVAFNRASVIAERSATRFNTAWAGLSRARLSSGAVGGLALLASSLTDVDEKAGLANTTLGASAGLMAGGPWGLAIGAAIGQVLDFKDAYSQANDAIEAADDALRNGNANDLLKERAALVAQLAKEHPDDGTLGNYFDAVTGSFHDFSGQTDDFKRRIAEIDDALKQGGGVADLFGETIGRTGDELSAASSAATDFSGALAALNGWFDKRDAVRAYKDSIDTLRQSLKDGFTREDAGNVDAIGRSILQVANNIKSPTVRSNFLAQARAQLVDMAEHSGPKAAAALQQIIDKFDDKGLTHPKITPEVDDSRAVPQAERIKNKVKGQFDIMDALAARPRVEVDDTQAQGVVKRTESVFPRIDALRAFPKVTVDPGNSFSILGSIVNMLGHVTDRHATVSVTTINHSVQGGAVPPVQHADGGTVPRSGRPYADRYHYMLADGEEVISNRYGQADRYRSVLKAINAGRMLADGGTSGSFRGNPGGGAYFSLANAANAAASGLRGLKKQLDAQQKAYDRAKSARDDAVSQRDSISSSIQSGLGGDIWAASSGSVWAAGAHGANNPAAAIAALNDQKARAQRLVAAINTLKSKGITGPVLLEIIGSGDVERAEAMASLDLGTLSSFSSAFTSSQSALAAAGLAGGNAVEGDNIRATQHQLAQQLDELRQIKQEIKQANSDNQQAHQSSAAQFTAGVNGAASNGHRRGK